MRFWKRHWFLIALFITLAVGTGLSSHLSRLASAQLARNVIVVVTLFVVTLPIESGRIKSSIRHPGPAILASGISYLVLPLLAWFVGRWLSTELAIGLMVCATAPSTIASAAVWTRRAGGNEMVPIFVTLITNLICFLVMPAWLSFSFRQSTIDISFADMASKLAMLVVLPMVAGQAVRGSQTVARWATRRQAALGILAQVGVLGIVLIGAVQCGLFVRQQNVGWATLSASLPILLVLLLTLNLMAFATGLWSARYLAMTRDDAVGVAFAGSQKTLMVGLQVGLMMGGGVTIIPMVLYHILQLVVGTMLADRLRR